MKNERGSALFYILIAVALLAALCYAVIQSSRGSISQVSDEKAKLIADDLMEYAGSISNAVAQLRLRGTKDTDLCFDDPSWGGGAAGYSNSSCSDEATKIFALKGGAITWRKVPTEGIDASAAPDYVWHIYGDNEIQDVGTTCGAAACADLILTADSLSLQVCEKINESLSVTPASTTPPSDTAIGDVHFVGTYGYDATIGAAASSAALAGKTAGCFQKTAVPSKYTFYKVLIAR